MPGSCTSSAIGTLTLPPRYPAILTELAPEELRELGEAYIHDTRVHRKGGPYFIDKMPNNFRDIGFIHLVLPNARIIDARREALPCCFGNFKQLFPQGMEFKYSQEELGRYYTPVRRAHGALGQGAARQGTARAVRGRGE